MAENGMKMEQHKKYYRWMYILAGIILVWMVTVVLFRASIAEALGKDDVGRAIVLAMNDVIYEKYSDSDITAEGDLQNEMLAEPALAGIAGRYVDVAVKAIAGQTSIEAPDVEDKRNEFVLRSLTLIARTLGDEHTSQPEFQEALARKADEGITRLLIYTNNLTGDSYLAHRYPVIRAAAYIYLIAVSFYGILVMTAAAILLFLYGMKKNGKKQALGAIGKTLMAVGAFEGILMSAIIKALQRTLSSSIAGRAIDMGTHYFVFCGCVFVLAGAAMMCWKKKLA